MQINKIPKFFLIFGLFLITFALYFNSLPGDFLIDDTTTILKNEQIHDLHLYFSDYFKLRHNVLNEVIRVFIWHMAKDNPFFYHLFNVLANSLCVIILFILCQILFKNQILSFLTALIFAVHPIHTEAVSWISGGPYVLSGLFFMLSFVFYLRSYRSFLNFALAIFTFIICFLVGNSVVVLPILFVFYDLFFRKKNPKDQALIKLRVIFLGFVVILSGLVVAYFFINQNKFMHMIFYYRGFNYLIVIAKAFVYYLKILYLPYQRGLFHPFAFNTIRIQEISPALFLSLIIFISAIITFFKCRKKIPAVSFGIGWFFITYLPYSNIVPIANIISERYLYLPSVGFSIVMAALFLKVWEIINRKQKQRLFWRKLALAALAIFIGSYSVLTVKQNYEYHDIITYWKSNIKNFSDGYMVYNNLAGTYYMMGNLKNAIAYCWINLMVNPNQPHVWYNLGKVSEKSGNIKQAKECYENVLKLDQSYFPAYEALEKIKNNEND